MKNIIRLLIVFLFVFMISGCEEENKLKYSIISTSFPGYDFAKAITKNSDINVDMLLKPGSEIHDFEPTPQDIIKIKNSDIFIYIGGESDEWIKSILKDINSKTKVIKLMDFVETYEEEIVEGMENFEEEKELDEHVWTSPVNAITIIKKLKEEIIKVDQENEALYEKNASDYLKKLDNIDAEIREIIASAKRKEIIFADRFPFRYFVNEYGLSYYAAFPGCSEATEASAKTIGFLINKVKEDKIPVIFKVELSSGKIAEMISKETNAKILEFNSAHNVSKADFDRGITYIDIMNNNVVVLKEALN